MHFFINRTDNIGDVILNMPLAAKLKQHFPNCKVSMLARNYAQEIVESCQDIDQFVSSDALFALSESAQIEYVKALKVDVFMPVYPNKHLCKIMKAARVPLRLGHVNRFYYLWYANKIMYIKRKRCELHQAQMCMQFLKAFKIPFFVPVEQLHELIRIRPQANEHVKSYLDPQAFNLVLHPGSNGNSIEWPKAHFAELIKILPANVKVYLTGSEKEAEKYGDRVLNERVTPLFGRFTLNELTSFLGYVDGVVVGSTGPLHIAAALGTKVLGLFPAQQDLNIKHWGPIGKNAAAMEAPHCVLSRPKDPKRCDCMKYITPEQVRDFIQQHWL